MDKNETLRYLETKQKHWQVGNYIFLKLPLAFFDVGPGLRNHELTCPNTDTTATITDSPNKARCSRVPSNTISPNKKSMRESSKTSRPSFRFWDLQKLISLVVSDFNGMAHHHDCVTCPIYHIWVEGPLLHSLIDLIALTSLFWEFSCQNFLLFGWMTLTHAKNVLHPNMDEEWG